MTKQFRMRLLSLYRMQVPRSWQWVAVGSPLRKSQAAVPTDPEQGTAEPLRQHTGASGKAGLWKETKNGQESSEGKKKCEKQPYRQQGESKMRGGGAPWYSRHFPAASPWRRPQWSRYPHCSAWKTPRWSRWIYLKEVAAVERPCRSRRKVWGVSGREELVWTDHSPHCLSLCSTANGWKVFQLLSLLLTIQLYF